MQNHADRIKPQLELVFDLSESQYVYGCNVASQVAKDLEGELLGLKNRQLSAPVKSKYTVADRKRAARLVHEPESDDEEGHARIRVFDTERVVGWQ